MQNTKYPQHAGQHEDSCVLDVIAQCSMHKIAGRHTTQEGAAMVVNIACAACKTAHSKLRRSCMCVKRNETEL